MSVAEPLLRELAEAYGIALSYEGNDGVVREVSNESVVAALTAFDVVVRTDEEAAEALRERYDSDWRRPLRPCTVVREGEPARLSVRVPAGSAPDANLVLENGGRVRLRRVPGVGEEHRIDGMSLVAVAFEVPASITCGYHSLEVAAAGATYVAELIIVPRFLGMPDRAGRARIWGYAVQLYSVTSAGSWGIGDLVDLIELADWSAGQGAQYLLTNPLHAAAPTIPLANSPYSPISRRFINPIYLRPEAIAEYAGLPGPARALVDCLRRDLLYDPDGADAIDRDAVWTAKIAAVRAIYDAGLSAERRAELERFTEANGPLLHSFALWCALAEAHGPDMNRWPEAVRDLDADALNRLTHRHSDRIGFHVWLQWVTTEQLAAAQDAALAAGMLVGVVNDLAVGVDANGAEVWADGSHYASGISIGAPPDAYNALGQGWGLAAWRPDRLAESGYRPFRDLVRSILRTCGGLRVDHIMGLFRLWWIPAGHGPIDGTYVHYDHDAMVGILMLEAMRADALVVGEDLGTVEPWVRDYLAERGILGTSVAWFERDPDGVPRAAERYRELCMASVTTHDLAPTEGYLEGTHLVVRGRLGLLQQPLADEQAAHSADLDRWRALLREAGVLRPGEGLDSTEDEILAMHRYLRSSPARVLNAALTDATGDRRMQNQPGTVDEYPNWRVPLTDADGRRVSIADLRRSARADRLAAVLNGD